MINWFQVLVLTIKSLKRNIVILNAKTFLDTILDILQHILFFYYGRYRNACTHAQSLQLWPTLCDPMDCSPPGSSVRGILQAGILEQVAILSSRGSSWPGIESTSPVSPALQPDSEPTEPSGKPTLLTKAKPQFSYLISFGKNIKSDFQGASESDFCQVWLAYHISFLILLLYFWFLIGT